MEEVEGSDAEISSIPGGSTTIVGIDLSARHSGAIVLRAGAEDTVVLEVVMDAGGKEEPWSHRLISLQAFWTQLMLETEPSFTFAIEDIHPFAIDPSQAYRMSGAMLMLAHEDSVELEFIKVSQWQSYHGKKRSDKGKKWAKVRAEELGYVPNKKQWKAREREDLVDAFLIAYYVAHKEDIYE